MYSQSLFKSWPNRKQNKVLGIWFVCYNSIYTYMYFTPFSCAGGRR